MSNVISKGFTKDKQYTTEQFGSLRSHCDRLKVKSVFQVKYKLNEGQGHSCQQS